MASAQARDSPTKPIRLIIPYAAWRRGRRRGAADRRDVRQRIAAGQKLFGPAIKAANIEVE